MSSSTSPVSDAKITFTPADCTIGFAATEIHCSANMMRPSPIRMRPKRPTRDACIVRKSTTPTKIRNGASHDKSYESTSVTSAVPTSAPSITESAGAVPINPCPANAATINAVAVLLWISAVTPSPAKNAEIRFDTLRRSTRRKSPPYRRKMPVRTICVPQTRSDTPASRLSSVCISASGSPRQRIRLDVGKAFHRLLHAFLVPQSRILDPAERRQFEAIAGHLADVDRADVQFGDEPRDVVQTIRAYGR